MLDLYQEIEADFPAPRKAKTTLKNLLAYLTIRPGRRSKLFLTICMSSEEDLVPVPEGSQRQVADNLSSDGPRFEPVHVEGERIVLKVWKSAS